MKKYFKYSFFNSFKTMFTFLLIGGIIYPLVLISTDFTSFQKTSQVGVIITYLAILTFVVPIFKNLFLFKKQAVDFYFSLPIKKEQLVIVNYLVGFLNIIIPYTILYFFGLFIVIIKPQDFTLIYYFPLYFISVLISLLVYTFNYFIVSRANSLIDALVFLSLYTFILLIPLVFVNEIIYSINRTVKFDHIESISYIDVMSFCLFINFGNYYACLIQNETLYNNITYLGLIIFLIFGITSIVLLYIHSKFDKAERSEQISTTYYGYKVLIPFYFILGLASMIIGHQSIETIFITAGIFCGLYLVSIIIYTRKIKIDLKHIYIILIYLFISLGFTLLFNTIIDFIIALE